MNWRKNGPQLSKRKAIRNEAQERMMKARKQNSSIDYQRALSVYLWAQGKIRRFYDVAPLSVVWPSMPRG